MNNFPFPSFKSYTFEMYCGNKPTRKGNIISGITNARSDYYLFEWGNADLLNDEIVTCSVCIDRINVYIISDDLKCRKITTETKGEKYFHIYEDDLKFEYSDFLPLIDINKITNIKNNDCFIIKKVKEKTKKIILNYCKDHKKRYAVLPDYFKNWYIENVRK